MEVIFTVSLMCHFKQSVNLFPTWWFNQCSLREAAIHHYNGSLDAVMSVVECLKRQHTIKNKTPFYAFPLLTINYKFMP